MYMLLFQSVSTQIARCAGSKCSHWHSQTQSTTATQIKHPITVRIGTKLATLQHEHGKPVYRAKSLLIKFGRMLIHARLNVTVLTGPWVAFVYANFALIWPTLSNFSREIVFDHHQPSVQPRSVLV